MASRTETRARGGARQQEPEQERGLVAFDAKERAAQVEVSLMGRRDQFVALLSGDAKLTDRFLTVALDTVVRSRDLLEADPLSLLTAIRTAATLGLEPTGVLGDGAIIARRDRNQGGKKIAAFQPMYRGLMRLARSSGQVASMDAAIVYENDVFEIVRGTEPRITHLPTLDDDMGGIKGAYAFAKLTSGELIVRYWPSAKLLRHRDRFAKDSTFWRDHPEPMMMKTVVHDLMKYLPLGHTASMAVAVDEAVDYGEGVPAPVLSRTARRIAAGGTDDGLDGPENGSGDAATGDAATDTAQDENGAQKPSTEPTGDADVVEGEVREADEPTCGKPGLKEGSACVREPHDVGPHRDADGTEWL